MKEKVGSKTRMVQGAQGRKTGQLFGERGWDTLKTDSPMGANNNKNWVLKKLSKKKNQSNLHHPKMKVG